MACRKMVERCCLCHVTLKAGVKLMIFFFYLFDSVNGVFWWCYYPLWIPSAALQVVSSEHHLNWFFLPSIIWSTSQMALHYISEGYSYREHGHTYYYPTPAYFWEMFLIMWKNKYLLLLQARDTYHSTIFCEPLGDSRKYAYHTTGGINIWTPLTFENSKMLYPPWDALRIPKSLTPPPFWNPLQFLVWLLTTSNERDFTFLHFPEVFASNFQSNSCLQDSKLWPIWLHVYVSKCSAT